MSVRPWGRRLAVVDPPAAAGPTALILPEGARDMASGVVVEVGDVEGLEPGCVVHFPSGCGRRVGEVLILDESCVVAWEPA